MAALRVYERTTSAQEQNLSKILSDKDTSFVTDALQKSDTSKQLPEFEAEKLESLKEEKEEEEKPLKFPMFTGKLENCTINFYNN